MNKNTIIFDMDGVIIDSEPFWREAQINELAKHNITIKVQDCIQYTMGKRLKDIADTWCLRYQLSIPSTLLQQNIMKAVIALILEKGSAKVGLYSLLKELKKHNCNIGLATSSSREIINAVLNRLDVESYFNIICSADDYVYGKPHPSIYLSVAKAFNVNVEECLVIEDSVVGMIAGKAAEMTTWVIPEDSFNPQFSLADASFSSLEKIRESLMR